MCNSDDGKKGNGDKRKQILGGGGKYKEYFLKRILIRKVIIVLREKKKKGLGRSTRFVPIGDQKQFLSNSLWEGDVARAKKHFQENQCEGRDGPPFSPVPGLLFQASLNSQAPGRRGGRAHAQPQEPFPLPLGRQKNFSVFGEYFRISVEKDVFLLSAHGTERALLPSSVRETVGTPERSAFLWMTGPPRLQRLVPIAHARRPAAPTWRPAAAVTAISYDCH